MCAVAIIPMPQPLTFSPTSCYLSTAFDEHGGSDDLDRVYGKGEPAEEYYRRNSEALRRLYPELSHWGLIGLFEAWSDFETDHLLVSSAAPYRTEMFLGCIILRSIAGFKSNNLVSRDGAWAEIDQALRWRDGKDTLPTPR